MRGKNNLIKIIKIPEIFDDCCLYFAQTKDHIPFSIKRVYYITKAVTKYPRGFHAHYKNRQVLFCIQGNLEMVLDNGKRKEKIILNKPNEGLLIDRLIWHEMYGFKKDTILLVLSSAIFDPKDYIRDYQKFLKIANGKQAS